MKLEQQLLDPALRWQPRGGSLHGLHPQLVLALGGRRLLEQPATLAALQHAYPGARLVMASTSGEILDTAITDDHVAVTAFAFERSHVSGAAISVRSQFESREAGRTLAMRLRGHGLCHVLVFSDGQLVNGTALADGFNEILPAGVTLTGGLAGDGTHFERTAVGLDELPTSGRIVALGLYGPCLQVGCGSSGGWSPDGIEHMVTAAEGNILFQLDGQPALDLYRGHLGESQAAALPASGLRFPFSVAPGGTAPAVVRTVLAVDESTRSMVFAGDVPCGSHVRFMQASHEDLIAGAEQAARQARLGSATELALCVSCVGRRLVLGPRTGEELAKVRSILGPAALLTGFYSYGELAPAGAGHGCQLHNQTMTITTLREK
jgi:hypothetical protein